MLLPKPQRRHVYAVYALCRLADDIVDADGATKFSPAATRQALAGFRAGFDRALAGDPPDATMAAIAHTVHESGIEMECFDRFFGAMAMDLDIDRLRHLGRPVRLHGGLGGGDRGDDAARAPAADARRPGSPPGRSGFAFQLTNFLRDVGEDLDRGRVYLPTEDLGRFGTSTLDRPRRRRLARA